jgi:hypothetical protein
VVDAMGRHHVLPLSPNETGDPSGSLRSASRSIQLSKRF